MKRRALEANFRRAESEGPPTTAEWFDSLVGPGGYERAITGMLPFFGTRDDAESALRCGLICARTQPSVSSSVGIAKAIEEAIEDDRAKRKGGDK